VLTHELGHVFGYGHRETGLMSPTLTPGSRDIAVPRLPVARVVAAGVAVAGSLTAVAKAAGRTLPARAPSTLSRPTLARPTLALPTLALPTATRQPGTGGPGAWRLPAGGGTETPWALFALALMLLAATAGPRGAARLRMV